MVGNGHDLAKHLIGRLFEGDVVADGLAHLLAAVGADRSGTRKMAWAGWPNMGWSSGRRAG
jgi:hypothetical protein